MVNSFKEILQSQSTFQRISRFWKDACSLHQHSEGKSWIGVTAPKPPDIWVKEELSIFWNGRFGVQGFERR
ncbi:hypothetical protein FKM82_029963 [Ascaphus truei]